MRRHPALRHLSSDHHTGLVLARKARQSANGSLHDQRYFRSTLVARFGAELKPHFQLEEDGLLPAMRRAGETRLVQRTLSEHASLRGLIAENQVENLAAFAKLLSAHIRFEEKELFGRAQQLLDQGQLTELIDESVSGPASR